MNKIEIDLDIVREYGLSGYLVMTYLNTMINASKNLGVNYFDGKYWTNQSIADIVKSYNIFSRGTINNTLRTLIDKGILEKRNDKDDKGSWNNNWYTFTEKGLEIINKQ